MQKKLAFIGNWNNWPLFIAINIANNIPRCHCKVLITRSDHKRCLPVISSFENTEMQSKMDAERGFLNYSLANELTISEYRINQDILDAIAWADVVFVGAELFFLKKFVHAKPVVGIPIGFEFQFWRQAEMDRSISDFYEAAAGCDSYIFSASLLDPEVSGNAGRFFLDEALRDRIFDFPFPPINFDISSLIIEKTKQAVTCRVMCKYLFYATRITQKGDALDDKGARLFFSALGLIAETLKANSVKVALVVRDRQTLDFVRGQPPAVQEILVLLSSPEQGDLSYQDFLHLCSNSIGVIECCGRASGAGLTAADAISLGRPIFSNFGHLSVHQWPKDSLIYDSSSCITPEDVSELLKRLLADDSWRSRNASDIKRFVEESPGFISDAQFAKRFSVTLDSLIKDYQTS